MRAIIYPFALKTPFGVSTEIDLEQSLNLFLSLTLKIWDTHREILAPNISPVSSFTGQTWFFPAQDPSSFVIWHTSGMIRLCDISKWGCLMFKQYLGGMYEVIIPWLQYMQVDHIFVLSIMQTHHLV